jgi:predicted MFS family arabinose efflux permease
LGKDSGAHARRPPIGKNNGVFLIFHSAADTVDREWGPCGFASALLKKPLYLPASTRPLSRFRHSVPDDLPMTILGPQGGPSPALISSFALACGVAVANLYYVQPLVGPVGQSLHLSVEASALVVTTMQLGYVAGLIFFVPLGDLIENRKLILVTLGGLVAACLAASVSPSAPFFMACCLCVGLTTTAAQMLIPLAAHLSPEERRGRIVGTVMSGLLIGILLARPFSTLVAGFVGWRGMFVISAAFSTAVIALLAAVLPRHVPGGGLHYGRLLASLWPLLRDTPVLRRRAFYQACLFGAFSLYWTAIPLVLTQPPFSLGPAALSLFMLSGAAGAFVAPLAGWLADHGYSRQATAMAFALAALAFGLAYAGAASIPLLVLAGIVLDAGVQGSVVIGQRAIYSLGPQVRSRLNALYLSLFFCGGALGSALAGLSFAHGGLPLICAIGLAFPAAAAAVFLTEGTEARI